MSEQQGFRHWLGLSRAIQGIVRRSLDPPASELDEVKAALDDISAPDISSASPFSSSCCVHPCCSAMSPIRRWR